MSTRMDKYNVSNNSVSRTERNGQLYSKIEDINIDYIDLKPEKVEFSNSPKDTYTSREEYLKRKKYSDIIGDTETVKVEEITEVEKNPKVYDINEILKKAKEEKIFVQEDEKKRFLNTEYNILTKLDLDNIDKEQEKLKEQNLKSLIDTIYSNSLVNEVKAKQEDDNKPLMNDIMATKIELDEEISKKILDDEYEEKENITEEKEDEKEQHTKEELSNLINKTLIGTDELLKITDEEEDNFDKDMENNDKFVVVIIIVALLIALIIAGVVLAKKAGLF